jgi:large subunit ribosomal protein L18e
MVAKIRNPLLKSDIIALKKAAKKMEKSRLWKTVAEYLERSRSRRVVVNVGKIAKLTKPGDIVIVPGKVLGGGLIDHKVIVGGFSFSERARLKITAAGGEVLPIKKFIEKYSSYKGVKLIGG